MASEQKQTPEITSALQASEKALKYSTFEEARDVLNHMAHVKMVMNSHKGDITKVPNPELTAGLANEVAELRAALDESDLTHVIEEAADVMNFTLAIVQQALNNYRGRKWN